MRTFTNAYEYLKAEIGDSIDSTDKLLRSMGKLVAHYCDAPLLMGNDLLHQRSCHSPTIVHSLAQLVIVTIDDPFENLCPHRSSHHRPASIFIVLQQTNADFHNMWRPHMYNLEVFTE